MISFSTFACIDICNSKERDLFSLLQLCFHYALFKLRCKIITSLTFYIQSESNRGANIKRPQLFIAILCRKFAIRSIYCCFWLLNIGGQLETNWMIFLFQIKVFQSPHGSLKKCRQKVAILKLSLKCFKRCDMNNSKSFVGILKHFLSLLPPSIGCC